MLHFQISGQDLINTSKFYMRSLLERITLPLSEQTNPLSHEKSLLGLEGSRLSLGPRVKGHFTSSALADIGELRGP